LNKVNLRATESSQVGDVINVVVSLRVLTVGTTNLDVILGSNSLELLLLVAELGKLDVDGGTETGTEVGGAWGDVAEVVVVSELGLLLNTSNTSRESLEDFTDVRAGLHRDDSELILLIDPDEESLAVVVEDTTSLGPVSLEEGRLKILVVALEEEVILSELLLLGGGKVAERVVLALKVTSELGKSSNNLSLYLLSLLSGNSGAKRVLSEVSANTDTGWVDHLVLIRGESGAVQLSVVHVTDVLISLVVAVIFINYFIEERSEGVVRVVGASVDTDARLSPLGARVDSLLKCESILIFLVLELFPKLGSKAAGEERLSSSGEVREISDLLGTLEVGADKSSSSVSFSNLQGNWLLDHLSLYGAM
jgi:hypothetical protein